MSVGLQNGMIRVLIADRCQASGDSLQSSLERSCKNLQIVGIARDQWELMTTFGRGAIDVALIGDGFMGSEIGGETLRSVHRLFPQIKLVAFLRQSDAASVVLAFRSGVRGVFENSATMQFPLLSKCIEAVHEGQIWASSNDLRHILEALGNSRPREIDPG